MTLARKKSRAIRVDGLDYRYKISTSLHDQDWNFELNVTIQIAHGKGSSLRVLGLVTRSFWLDFPKPSESMNEYPVILPGHIEAFIRQGLLDGWTPEIPGPAYKMNLENEKVFK